MLHPANRHHYLPIWRIETTREIIACYEVLAPDIWTALSICEPESGESLISITKTERMGYYYDPEMPGLGWKEATV